MINRNKTSAALLPLVSLPLLALSATTTHADEALLTNSPWSINLMVGIAHLDPKENNSGRGLQAPVTNNLGFGAKVGYDFGFMEQDFTANVSFASLGAVPISEPAPTNTLLGDLNYSVLGIGVEWFPWGSHETYSPYLNVGGRMVMNDVTNTQIRYDHPGEMGYSIAGGVIWNYLPNWGLTADLTYFDTTAQFASVGVRYQFGCPISCSCGLTPAPTPLQVMADNAEADRDKDGVIDKMDQCPGTPEGQPVDQVGCELDDDKDLVVNGLDQCPDTEAGVRVNMKGCGLDGDADGVFDGLDQCPNSAPGVKVDLQGCEVKAEVIEEMNITLDGVLFEFDSAELKGEFKTLLDDKITPILLKHPSTVVEISGHTDDQGGDDYNLKLSQARAESVVSYLIGNGVKSDRIRAKGYGEERPIASNDSEEGQAKNRRVEIQVVSANTAQ